MEVDLPQLPQRVGLDEVALVVDVEAVVDRLTLHVGDETCNVDHCHAVRTLPSTIVDSANEPPADRRRRGRIGDRRCSPRSATALVTSVSANSDWAESGVRRRAVQRRCRGRSRCASTPLLGAGFDVLSEETGIQHARVERHRRRDRRRRSAGRLDERHVSGCHGSRRRCAGWSTASRSSSMVTNLATGERFEAIAGRGATSSGLPLSVRAPLRSIGDAIVARQRAARSITSGGGSSGRWARRRSTSVRSLAAASTDSSTLSPDAHGVWDYAGAMLVVRRRAA